MATNPSITYDKNCALRKACGVGRVDDVIRLLDEGADPTQTISRFPSYSSIHYAAMEGNVEILTIILNTMKVMIDDKDGSGRNPLMIACSHGRLEAVKYLIEYGTNVDEIDDDGETLLHWAVWSNSVETVDECLKWVNVDTKDKNGRTPLIFACDLFRHSTAVVLRLLDANASLNERDNKNHSALSYAYYREMWDTVDLLLQQSGIQIEESMIDDIDFIHCLIRSGSTVSVNLMLQYGISLNSKDQEGRTLLHHASMGERMSTVALLLKQQKINIDIKDKYGNCAIDVTENQEIKDLILQEKEEREWHKQHRRADDLYKLTTKGLSIIINQRDFHMDTNPAYKSVLPSECLEKRNGTDFDCWKLKSTFEKFNSDTMIKENITQMEMRQFINYLAKGDMDKLGSTKKLEELNRYSCLVFCVLSHGVEGHVYGSNCVPLHIYNDIIYKFNSADCPPLKGKPKIFIIQACQGERTTFVCEDNSGASSSSGSIPEISDFLVAFPTIPGHTSLRDPHTGSPFIQTLCKYIEDYGDKKDIEEILRMTRKELSTKTFINKDGESVTISAQCNSVLRNKLILRSSESNDTFCSVT